ncbi:hypothetical protein Hanom_Chr16g01482041 [Helianthus anomalus]
MYPKMSKTQSKRKKNDNACTRVGIRLHLKNVFKFNQINTLIRKRKLTNLRGLTSPGSPTMNSV